MTNTKEGALQLKGNSEATTEQQALPGKRYEAPELHEVGGLGKLQHYGFNYNDGYRYKNDY
jgi:hypothetical protein